MKKIIVLHASLFSVFASSVVVADDSTFTDKVKARVEKTTEWTKKKCDALRHDFDNAVERGKVTWQNLSSDIQERLGKSAEENNPRPGRSGNETSNQPALDLQVPWEIKESGTPAGSEPITRGGAVITQEEVGGSPVTITSIELPQDQSWTEWLQSEEGKKFGTGAVAVVTILGVTYVLYKNRVPQRIYGYVTNNPIKSVMGAVCILGISAYVAQQRGVTLDSIKDALCLPLMP